MTKRISSWLVLFAVLLSPLARAQTVPPADKPAVSAPQAPSEATADQAPSAQRFSDRIGWLGLSSVLGEVAGLATGVLLVNTLHPNFLPGTWGVVDSAAVVVIVGATAGAILGAEIFGLQTPGGATPLITTMTILGGALGTFAGLLLFSTPVAPVGFIMPAVGAVAGYALGYSLTPPAPPSRRDATALRISPAVGFAPHGGGQLGLVGMF